MPQNLTLLLPRDGRSIVIRSLLLILLILQPLAANASAHFRIAVAANFRSTLEIILEQYRAAQPDVSIEFSSGSSGSLYQQILHGAPYQLFLSADSRYPKQLEAQGLLHANFRATYAIGELVLWAPLAPLHHAKQISSSITLAVANPKTAPYGRAAAEVIAALSLQPLKIIQGHSIAQVHQFVASGNADAGFIARSQVLNTGQVISIEKNLYNPIQQQMALLTPDNSAAKDFYRYLLTPAAQQIIRQHGYQLPEPQSQEEILGTHKP